MENLSAFINQLEERIKASVDPKLNKWLNNIVKLLIALEERGVNATELKQELEKLSSLMVTETKPYMFRSYYSKLADSVQKRLNLTAPNYFQNQWMGLGMLVFGIPMGVVFSTSFGNFAFIGIGIPIGLSLGMAIGAEKDKKAKAEGRQLNI